jgi:TonB family protein
MEHRWRWWTIAIVVWSAAAAAETPVPPDQPDDPSTVAAVGGRFVKPQVIHRVVPKYPRLAQQTGHDGWVQLSILVDTDGKPHSVEVVDSSSYGLFERAAIEAAEQWRFEPAQQDGVPIAGQHALKLVFALEGGDNRGARLSFFKAYNKVLKAIDQRDRAAADLALASLDPRSLYEDAYQGMAEFSYALAWDSPDAQLGALRRAVAYETKPTYLSEKVFVAALQQKFRLEVKTNLLGDALDTWAILKEQKLTDQDLPAFQEIVDEIERLRTDDRSFAMAGTINTNGYAVFGLLKNRFRVVVDSGAVQHLQLRCEREARQLTVDPALEFTISGSGSECKLWLKGEPDSKFQIVQS